MVIYFVFVDYVFYDKLFLYDEELGFDFVCDDVDLFWELSWVGIEIGVYMRIYLEIIVNVFDEVLCDEISVVMSELEFVIG